MAAPMDASRDAIEDGNRVSGDPAAPIDDHLLAALESPGDEWARYHLREALQLQIADAHRR